MRPIWKWIIVISAGALIAYGMNFFTDVDHEEDVQWLRTRNDRPTESDSTVVAESQSGYSAEQKR